MRVKLSEKFKDEREDICNKLIEILDLDEKKSFLLNDLDNDVNKQNAILSMKDEIKKYFAVSCISAFKPNFECKRPYLNIVRSILRKQNYTFECKNTMRKTEIGNYQTFTKYRIFRNN
ncbi:MAG: hypothetical protein ACYSOT_08500 [Planctomycetota bacterium]|jgi:hypothetical protein